MDADYRGETGIIIVNLSNKEYTVNDGERICKVIVSKHERVKWNEVDELNETKQGDGGFGHKGSK
ncbi:MAG: hypothetical protein R6X28_08680 [Bacteroidales bacterium]